MKKQNLVVVTAGLSEPSTTALLGDKIAASATTETLQANDAQVKVQGINLRALASDITNHFLTGFPAGKLPAALDAVYSADAIIVVTPTFKASYSGLFKSFWDLVEDGSLAGVPVLLAATGGTARHSLVIDAALRPLFSYLKAMTVPSGVFAATDDFGADDSLQGRIDKATGELAQMMLWRSGAAGELKRVQRADAGAIGGAAGARPVPAVPSPSTVGAAVSDDTLSDTDLGFEAGGEYDDANGNNSGSFFGIATERKAPGLEPLKLVPFDQLLKQM